MSKSSIEWTQQTWNPTIGCSEQSPGCTHCYAALMAYRLMHIPKMKGLYDGMAKRLPNGKITWTGEVKVLEERLLEPFLVKKPTIFFVNSMSDLFHPSVPFEFIHKVFVVMALNPQHTFQILTKQPKRALEYFKKYENNGFGDDDEVMNIAYEYFNYIHILTYSHPEYGDNYGDLLPAIKAQGWFWDTTYSEYGKDSQLLLDSNKPLQNIWIGVSVESDKYEHRIDDLRLIPAAVRFISYEPALSSILPDLTGINWLIWAIIYKFNQIIPV